MNQSRLSERDFVGPWRDHAVAEGSDQFSWKSWTCCEPGVVSVRRRRCRRGVEMVGEIMVVMEVDVVGERCQRYWLYHIDWFKIQSGSSLKPRLKYLYPATYICRRSDVDSESRILDGCVLSEGRFNARMRSTTVSESD
jgi:hypothetical protein